MKSKSLLSKLEALYVIDSYWSISVYVQASTNGVLSFGDVFVSFTATTLPRTTMALPLMAVLWRDFDFSFSGSIYHRQANDTETLARVRSMIADVNPELSDYQPTLAVIVTWFEAKIRNDFSEFSVSFMGDFPSKQ